MMISKISTDHQEALERLENDLRKESDMLKSHERELKLVMEKI